MPRFSASRNQMVEGEAISLLSSAARTVTGQSAAVNSEAFDDVLLELDVTVASGTTPTLNVTIETRKAAGAWRSIGTFTQKTGVSADRQSFSGTDEEIRANYAIAGTTPSFTFSIAGYSK